ncbi:MAG: LysM peptidoglycan-binding domain-containing protein, partial [Saprospiraceae bacterium]
DAYWMVVASYSENKDWLFSFFLEKDEKLSLNDILGEFLDFHSQYIPQVEVNKLYFSSNLSKKTYDFSGEVSTYWNVDIFPQGGPYILAGINLENYISGYDEVADTDEHDTRGSIYGSFAINDFLTKVKYSFAPNTDTIEFSIRFRKLELIADLLRRNIGESNEEVLLEIGLGDLTFGEVVEYLVNLADPDADFALTAPWTILNQINFKDIKLLVNLTTEAVGVVYELHRDFVFARIDTLSLTYCVVRGKGKVMFEYTGRLLDQTYDINNPVGWDLLDDPAPAVPSSELALFKIKYLGIGQHVAMDNVQQFNHVIEVIDALKASMQPVEDAEQNPLTQQTGLSFNENSKWLFGLDIELIRMLSLSLVFNDPQLYGVSLGLSGERAGALAGLQFEVLYIKVTDDIGVFKIELRVPDAFRQLDFGQVSVTLPVLKLEIFTNGNFKVDLGFPVNGDFTDSFCLQVFPYIGYGGFYFASLNGATSDRVPTISNGTFSPVIEAGLGLSIGLGKTFNKGVLKAGLTLTVEGILEGCLAWYNPDDTSSPDPMYYWLQGTVALVGKLFGYVDFKVIKVDVSVTARLSTTLTIEAYAPIEIEFKVSVEIEASAKVAFITVNFSFEEELSASFIIGAPRRTPWRLGERDNSDADAIAAAKRTPRLRMQRPHRRRFGRRKLSKLLSERQAKRLRASRTTQAKVETTPRLYFSSDCVFNSVQTVQLSLLPNPTVADPTTLQYNEAGNTEIGYQINMLLFAENTIPVDATTAAAAQMISGDDPANTPFNLLVQGMLRYALNAYLGASESMVNELQLETIHELLDTNSAENTGFSYENIKAFLQNNYEFIIRALPTNNSASTPANAASATIFPMIPELLMSVGGFDEVAFWDKNIVSADYEAAINAYFDQLSIDYSSQVADRPFINVSTNDDTDSTASESMATMIFRDYFGMIAKAAVQESINLLQEFPYPVQANQSLFGIANASEFPRVTLNYSVKKGDTITSVAEHYSVFPEAVAEINGLALDATLAPGQTLQIHYGVTVADVALSNQDQPLRTGIQLDIRGIHYQVASGDSLNSIGDKFHLDFSNLAFNILTVNEYRPDIFANGQTITIAKMEGGEIKDYFSYYANHAEDKEQYFLAAFFTCRTSLAELNQTQFSWYRQTIIDLNPTIDFSRIFAEVDAATGNENQLSISLNIPSSYQNDDENTARTYTIRPYDSLPLIAGYFTLQQNPTPELMDYARAIGPIGLGGIYKIPAIAYTLQSTDDYPTVIKKFTTYHDSLVTKAIGTAINLLNPLAVLEIPTIKHVVTEGETLTSIAAYYNITIEELALGIENQVDIFPADTILTVENVPQLSIAALQENIIHNGHSNKIAAMVSRFLLYGLRLPWDNSANNEFTSDTPLYSIYDLTGQQFSAAEFAPNEPINIEFKSREQSNNWLNFANSYIIQRDDTVNSLSAAYPNIQGLNPQINWVDPLPFGAIIYTQITLADAANLFTALDNNNQNFPSTTFTPDFTPPRALPLFEEHPRRYDLPTYAHWQTSENLTLPNPANSSIPATGEPSIWFFPKALFHQVGRGKFNEQAFQLYRFDPAVTDDDYPTVDRYAWATHISFQIRLVSDPNQSDEYLSNTYEIVGASNSNTDRLEALWIYANSLGGVAPQAHLLYAPNATDINSTGLMSDVVAEEATFLLKTNLSTNDGGTEPNPALGDYHATFNDSISFMKYLWEAFVVMEGGYHLYYVKALDGGGIPVTTFDESGIAEVSLLVTLAPQTDATQPDRTLLNFVNCAIVGDNIDAGLHDIFVAAEDHSDAVRIATVPAGNVGFEVTGNLPANTDYLSETSTEKTRSLYSLLGYHLVENQQFNGSIEGLPIGPTKSGSHNGYYHQLVPIATFAKTSAVPNCPALPPVQADPYAGIYHNNQGLGKATFAFDFHDLFGNRLGQEEGASFADLSVPVGYYDEVIGFGQWPGITSSYLVRPFSDNDPQPVLDLYFEFQINNYLPGNGMGYAQAIRNTSAHLARYQQIWYQLQQTDVDVRLVSTLGVDYSSSHKRHFITYLNAVYTFLAAAQRINNYQYPVSNEDNLATIIATYGIDYSKLAEVNAQVQSTDLFSGTVQIPYYLVVVRNETVDSVIETASGISNTAFTVTDLLENNPSTKLTANIIVKVTPYIVFVNPEAEDVANNNLLKIAQVNNVTVSGLTVLNEQAGIIAGGIELYVGIYQYTTTENDSLLDITDQFNRLAQRDDPSIPAHFTIADIAVAIQSVKGLIITNAVFQINEYVTQTGDTLSVLLDKNGNQTENWTIPNLLLAGESLHLFNQQPAGFVNDRLENIANTYGLTVGELFAANATTELRTDSNIVIPALLTIPSTALADNYVPYATRSNESLNTIADHFDIDVHELTETNRYIPYLFQSKQEVTVDGVTGVIKSKDSFQMVIDRFATQYDKIISLAELTDAIKDDTDILGSNAYLACPLPQTQDVSDISLHDLAHQFHLTEENIAETNTGLVGFLREGSEVNVNGNRLTINPNDTLTTLVNRYQQQFQIEITLQELVAHNKSTNIIAANTYFLLPPKSRTKLISLQNYVDGTPSFTETLFKLKLIIEILRDKEEVGLIDPEFTEQAEVKQHRTKVPP